MFQYILISQFFVKLMPKNKTFFFFKKNSDKSIIKKCLGLTHGSLAVHGSSEFLLMIAKPFIFRVVYVKFLSNFFMV
jgi:hypothetical protein